MNIHFLSYQQLHNLLSEHLPNSFFKTQLTSAAAFLSTKHMKIRGTPVPRIFNDKPSHFVHQKAHSVDKPYRKHHFVHQNPDSVDKPSRSATSSLKSTIFKDDHRQKCEFVLKSRDFKDEHLRWSGHHRRNVRYPPVTGRAGKGGSIKGPPSPPACCQVLQSSWHGMIV